MGTINKIGILFLLFIFAIKSFAQISVAQNGIVASAHELASKTGIEILKQGGNAVDAAVATAFVLSVVEPYASGIGGGGFMTIKMKNSKPITIDYREKAPAKATNDLYYSNDTDFKLITTVGAKAIGVPGVLMGLTLALQKFGTMSLSRVIEPAIRIANDGYEVSQTMYDIIIEEYGVISQFEETSKIYLDEGLPPEIGYRIQNTDLADSYKEIGEKGINTFYKNRIANKIIDAVQTYGGILTLNDLNNYEPIIKQPVIGKYKGFEIVSSAPPSGGGTHLVELLNILEHFDLKKLGLNSAEYIHVFAEAIKIVQSDKTQFMADPNFVEVPVDKLTSNDYAKTAAGYIDPDKAKFDWIPGGIKDSESGSTTSLSVIDKDYNMVTITQSLNLFFGCGITIPSTGIILNNHLDNFESLPDKANSIEPNKRPVSSIAPTIILKDGKPILTFGTPGGSRIIGTMAQVLVNIIDFGMSFQDAITSPKFHATNQKLHLENRIPESVVNQLEQKGHEVEIHPAFDKYFGGVQGVMIDYKNKNLIGAADPRRGGSVQGY